MMNIPDSELELRSRLVDNGITVVGGPLSPGVHPSLTAVLVVTGGYVQPTVTVPRSAPDLKERLDRKWEEQAEKMRLRSTDGRFLLRLSNPGSESRGWLQVHDSVIDQLPSRISIASGHREFIAASLDSKRLCAVSLEDEEDWIVTHEFS
ncbi:hypothetical protein [Streptomyces jumonjinensis]|uniref:hypothetical protein n=1 Tax=Streptomyces jumonjinensis TaxID=1945 RepID=UPI0037B7A22F